MRPLIRPANRATGNGARSTTPTRGWILTRLVDLLRTAANAYAQPGSLTSTSMVQPRTLVRLVSGERQRHDRKVV